MAIDGREQLLSNLMEIYEHTPEAERKELEPSMLMMGHMIEFLDYFMNTFSDADKLIDEVVTNKSRKIMAIDECLKDAIDVLKGENYG